MSFQNTEVQNTQFISVNNINRIKHKLFSYCVLNEFSLILIIKYFTFCKRIYFINESNKSLLNFQQNRKIIIIIRFAECMSIHYF